MKKGGELHLALKLFDTSMRDSVSAARQAEKIKEVVEIEIRVRP
jgi:hypothetical protein